MSAPSDDQHETATNYFTPTISSKYVNTFSNSPVHNEWVSSLMYDLLELQPGHILVDMGCGPGIESKMILDKMKDQIRVIGVDPSQGMLDEFRKELGSNPNIETVCMDAVTFSQSIDYSSYDRIFLKGMVHLLTHEELFIAFEGFYKQLLPTNGKLLIILGADSSDDLPFDERTKRFFENFKFETLFDALKHAGFKQIQRETFTYEYPPNSVTAEDWIYILENRVWTILSKENINDQQMKDLIDHVRRQFESPNNFQTVDIKIIIKCSAE